MESIVEVSVNSSEDAGAGAIVAAPQPSVNGPLETLTSGRRKDLKGGGLQAHICVVTSLEDVREVMEAFKEADAFKGVVSWSYAYRINTKLGAQRPALEDSEDDLDEGCGDRMLSILKLMALDGLLLVVSRWQDYGATHGLELFGTVLYGIYTERCKDLILHLKKVVGLGEAPTDRRPVKPLAALLAPPPGPREFVFDALPPLKDPRAPMRFGPNHFMAEMPLSRPSSLPCLFSGGDVRLWMENDKCLRELPDAEIWALRSLRQPDERIERVLQAVAVIRGQKVVKTGAAAARWGHCLQVLRSATFRTELLLIDAAGLPLDVAHGALQLLSGLEASELRRISPAAAALLEWAMGVARWRIHGPPPPEAEYVEVEPLIPKEMSPNGLQRLISAPALDRGPPRCLRLRRRALGAGATAMVLTR